MKENDKDTAFNPGTDKTPEVIACLIHPRSKPVRIHTVKEFNGYEVVTFGMCWSCEPKLKDPKFQKQVDDAICARLDQLTKEGEPNGSGNA